MALLEVRSVYKSFPLRGSSHGHTPVLRDVSFQASRGETVCLLGPSGCGKTTLLRIIAGLERADAGQVLVDGTPYDDVPVHRRGFGLMFQDFALFPHKDVAANVAFGLRMGDLPREEIETRTTEMITLVGLAGYDRRRVYDLSGGEQQRVALARSLAPGPRLLMLDEPLGSLDRALREELMNELRAILGRVGVTAVYVTHDQEEAFAIADRILLLNQGRIVQQGPPHELYRRPNSAWVARFLGLTNLIPGRVTGPPVQVETPLGRFPVHDLRESLQLLTEGHLQSAGRFKEGQRVTVLIRPESARLAGDCPEPEPLLLEGIVRDCSFRGGHYRLVVTHPSGCELAFELVASRADLPQRGQTVTLALRPDALSLLPEAADDA